MGIQSGFPFFVYWVRWYAFVLKNQILLGAGLIRKTCEIAHFVKPGTIPNRND